MKIVSCTQRDIKLKICGLKFQENIKSLENLNPDYFGFIFYDKSKRNFDGIIPKISSKIKKTGVFVNENETNIWKKMHQYKLDAIQLHGEESPDFCKKLKSKKDLEIIKVFSVGKNFNFSVLKEYENACDYFLFDTKGKDKGGNGITFDWNVLNNTKSTKPFFLSGGIGLEEVNQIINFFKSDASKNCIGIDINSRFEDNPGLKNVLKIKSFINNLNNG